MAVPTDLTQVSVTAASNSPAGSDAIGVSLDDFLRQIQAMLKEAGATLYTASGTADAINFNTTPTFSAYTTGQRFWIKSSGENTGAVTLNINSLGSKNVYKSGTFALEAGDIPSGSIVSVIYDGTQFQLGTGSGGGAKANGAIYLNKKVISADFDITADYNAHSVGPITVNTGVAVTVASGSRWVIS